MSKLFYFAVTTAVVALCYRYFWADKKASSKTSLPSDWDDLFVTGEARVFNKSIVKVTDGVHVALYYGMANVAMLEGEDGIVIVDSTESSGSIEKTMKEFRKITDKPLKAIILTHYHPDHIRGLEWLLEDAGHPVEVYAHRLAAKEISKSLITAAGAYKRMLRQFGFGLQKKATNSIVFSTEKVNSEFLTVRPTHIVDGELETTVAGLKLKLIHIPSESADHVAVWFPAKKLAITGDIVYGAFPNIAPVRGDFARSAVDWFNNVDTIRYLSPEFLVAGHMPPLSGEDKVHEFLTNYRDAIQYVHDQTVRLTNKGLHISDIVRQVKLPSTLAELPYLQGQYGTVEWTVRAIYTNYTGWFSGEAHELNPLTIKEHAGKMGELLEEGKNGGSAVDAMIRNSESNAKKSLDHFDKTGEFLFVESQWALEVASTALTLSQEGTTEHERAKKAKIDALVIMARISVSLTAKNYYLSCAAELDGSFSPPELGNARKTTVNKMDIEDLMSLFTKTVNPDKCDPTTKITALLYFTDLAKTYAYLLRNCVIEYVNDDARLPATFDVKLTMTSQLWRDLANKERGGMGAYMSGDLQSEGSMMSFKRLTDVLN